MDSTIKILRLHIDGRWSAQEFGELLLSITDLYNLRLVLEVLRNDRQDPDLMHYEKELSLMRQLYFKRQGILPPPFFPYPWPPSIPVNSEELLRLSRYLYPAEVLNVRRIRYGSKGIGDLTGLGAVIGHIKDFILRLVELHTSREQRHLENAKLRSEIVAKDIENAQSLVSLAQQCGYSQSEIRKLVGFASEKQEPIIKVIEQQKLLDVTLPENDDPSGEAPNEASDNG